MESAQALVYRQLSGWHMSDCLCKHSKMSTVRYWNQTKKYQSGPFLNGIWGNLKKKKSYTTGSKIPLGASSGCGLMERHGLHPCSGTASSPLPSSTCPSCPVCSTLSVVSPLFLWYSGFAFLHQAVFVNKNPGSGGQELDWRDAAFPDQDMVKFTRYRTFPPFALPGSDVDNDRQFPGCCCPEMHHLVPFGMR